MTHSSLQTFASRVLAIALGDCLPGVRILEVGASMGGFFCDFSFPSQISTEILIQLEERIRQIIREKRPVKVMEMVPFSASELLKKSGQTDRAKQVLSQEDYVRIIQIGSFVDWYEGLGVSDTGKAGMVRLVDKETLSNGCYRIFGMAAAAKDELNPRIKQWNRYDEWSHESCGTLKSYWEVVENEIVWLTSGLEARRRLCEHWRNIFLPIAFEVEGDEALFPLLAKSQQVHSLMYFDRIEEVSEGSEGFWGMRGLLDGSHPLVLKVKSLEQSFKSCTSLLQSVHKSLTILGLTYRILFRGKKNKEFEGALAESNLEVDEWVSGDQPKLEFLVSDHLQCEWVIAAVVGPWRKSGASLTVWVERNFALLLEKNGAL